MDFRDWILERLTPAVMVVSSPEAEQMCQEKNGLTVVDLLRPYGFLHQLSVPVRTVGEHAYRIREFRVRFYRADMMFQPSPEASDEHLKGVLNAAAKESHAVEIPDVMAALQSGKGFLADNTPWWDKYRNEFFRMMQFGELETFDHPVACLLVLHAHADNPVEAFGRLFHSARKPPLMADGKMEHRIVMHHLLIHGDNVQAEGGYARSEEKLKASRVALGTAAVHLIRINSGKGDPTAVLGYESLWRHPLPGTLPGGGAGEPPSRPSIPTAGYGACLTKANLDDIKRFLEDFAVRALLPAMEARVRALNHQVTSTRKGLRNQLKTLLWRKQPAGAAGAVGRDSPLGSVHGGSVHGGSAGTSAANGSVAAYGVGSVEGQMRALADLAFTMQDYDTALSTLRLLASDLRADKAWKHYAAVQEMIGISLFMARGTMADVLGAFKEAFYRYNSAAPHEAAPRECVRYATRAMLLAAEYARQHGAYSEANYALMKAHFQEENLRAALLLEQAALCLLRVSPPSVRKYAFHMVLAGLRYNACDQKALGMRAYRQVLSVYKGHKWAFIEEHIHDVLGKQSRDTGDFDLALMHFAAMLQCSHSPPYWQAHYLKQFLDTVTAATKAKGAAPVLELPLPEVDAGHVTVQADDEICHGNPESRAQPEDLWRSLEGPLLSALDIGATSWLDAGGSSKNVAALQLGTAVAGEMIEVLISLGNPLTVDLQVSRLRLMFEPEPMPKDKDLSQFAEVQEQSVVLKGGERVRLSLGLRPLRPGLLTLTGVEWLLDGKAPGRKLLTPKRPKHRRSASRAPTKAEKQSQCLSFNVLDALPRLEASVEQLPATLLAGEVRKCTLQLRNTGKTPLRGIRAVCSGPDVFLPLDNADLDRATLDSLAPGRERAAGTLTLQEPCMRLRRGLTLYTWPAGKSLGPGETLQWPLWVHPRERGQFDFHLAILFEPQAPDSGMSYRVVRLSHSVDVLPSLDIAASLAASRADLVTFLLRLQLRNMQGLQALTVRQVSCLSQTWRISQLGRREEGGSAALPPPSTSTCPSIEISAAAAATAYFRLHPPEPADATASGEEWVLAVEGPLEHFHRERLRRQALESEPEQQFPTRPSKAELQRAALEPQPEPSTSETPDSKGPDIVVVWSLPDAAGKPRCIGAHHIYDLQEKEKVVIRATLRGEERLRHSFRGGGMCAAALQLDLRNCSDATASLCIETGTGPPGKGDAVWRRTPELAPQSSTAAQSATAVAPEPPSASGGPLPVGARSGTDYVWCGSVRTLVPSLPAGQATSVTLRVAVMAPGVYDISDYLIRWAFPDVDKLQYSQPGPPIMLRVEDEEQ